MIVQAAFGRGFSPLTRVDHHFAAQPGRATVYVVDDDDAVRAAISMLVGACGWNAVPCASAADFLDRYSPGDHQCLVVDLRMPGLSGIELQLELRRRGDAIPIIVVTAHDDHADAELARVHGAQAVLGKPFRDDELVVWIERALASD